MTATVRTVNAAGLFEVSRSEWNRTPRDMKGKTEDGHLTMIGHDPKTGGSRLMFVTIVEGR